MALSAVRDPDRSRRQPNGRWVQGSRSSSCRHSRWPSTSPVASHRRALLLAGGSPCPAPLVRRRRAGRDGRDRGRVRRGVRRGPGARPPARGARPRRPRGVPSHARRRAARRPARTAARRVGAVRRQRRRAPLRLRRGARPRRARAPGPTRLRSWRQGSPPSPSAASQHGWPHRRRSSPRDRKERPRHGPRHEVRTAHPTPPTPSPSGSVSEPRPAATRSRSRCAAAPRTYAELDEISDRVGAGFAELGLAGGEHVALMMANSIENVESWFGLTKAGLVEVPIHTASRGGALAVHRRPRRRPGARDRRGVPAPPRPRRRRSRRTSNT